MSDGGLAFALDHLVLTVSDVDATCDWYERVLGMTRVESDGRVALRFGSQKLNLHPAASPYEPHAAVTAPGSADVCLLTSHPVAEVVALLGREDVPVELGPVVREGARGPMDSVYVRDPDRNLIEIARYR